jgi:hypothetical protein
VAVVAARCGPHPVRATAVLVVDDPLFCTHSNMAVCFVVAIAVVPLLHLFPIPHGACCRSFVASVSTTRSVGHLRYQAPSDPSLSLRSSSTSQESQRNTFQALRLDVILSLSYQFDRNIHQKPLQLIARILLLLAAVISEAFAAYSSIALINAATTVSVQGLAVCQLFAQCES